MICRNCGFHNAPGDAFCGSCGQFLEWTGEQGEAQQPDAQADAPADDETALHPIYEEPAQQPPAVQPPPPPSARPSPPDEPPRMARPAAPGVTYGAIVCWNCGRRNPASRAFCQQCGERLTVSSLAGAHGDMARPAPDRARLLAIVVGVLALLLLAGGAAAIFLGGSGPGASPTPTGAAIVTSSPEASPTTLPTPLLPTEQPSPPPTEQPPEPPTEPPPPATPVNCSASTVPTNWVNLTGGDTSARVRREQTWCIHQVIVVPDPNFGDGRIRLMIGNQALVDITHDGATGQTEYPFSFSPAHLVPPRTDVTYRMNCAGDFCNAIIQVGYELISTP